MQNLSDQPNCFPGDAVILTTWGSIQFAELAKLSYSRDQAREATAARIAEAQAQCEAHLGETVRHCSQLCELLKFVNTSALEAAAQAAGQELVAHYAGHIQDTQAAGDENAAAMMPLALVRDPATGELVERPIVKVWEQEAKATQLAVVTIGSVPVQEGNAQQDVAVQLRCTPEHVFITPEGEIEAQALAGKQIWRVVDGAVETFDVVSVQLLDLEEPVIVYDAEIEGIASYCAGSPEAPSFTAVVHNSTHEPDPSRSLKVDRLFSRTETVYEWRDVVTSPATGEKTRCRVPVKWSDNSASIIMSKYAVRAGVPGELGGVEGREVDAERIFDRLVTGWRIAALNNSYWGSGEYADADYLDNFCAELKAMLEQQIAAPNSPQWFNTGVAVQYGIKAGSDGHYKATPNEHGDMLAHRCEDSLEYPQISACFIQSVRDNLVGEGGIMNLWHREARLFKYGSGSGANYSAIRGKGEGLSRGGESSGLLSFLRVGDRSAGAVKSGGTTRRSARMVIVDDDHPDVLDFIGWKSNEDNKIRALHAAGFGDPSSFEDEATETVSGQNANNSVSVSDAFLSAVESGTSWDLRNRVDGSVAQTVDAQEMWERIAEAAWSCADPGLQFRDSINNWHTCKSDGNINASNPCSEYVFLDDTACNLASLNLAKFYAPNADAERYFKWDAFAHAVRLWTIVLDISVSMAGYPTAEIARRSMLYRTLGLGYAALGELLVLCELGYGTQEGRDFAAEITSTMTACAYMASVELAHKLGAFPRYERNRSSVHEVLRMHYECAPANTRSLWHNVRNKSLDHGVRNAQVSLLAPTGTIGIVMGCETTGVEPYFSDTVFKQLAGGGFMRLPSALFSETLKGSGFDPEEHTRKAWTVEDGHVREYVWIEPPESLKDVLVCADDLTPQQHIDMMAAVQPFLSGAISKTINMPADSTVEDIAGLHRYAWKQGLKSVAIYRDGCKPSQPLQGRKPKEGVETFNSRKLAELFLAAAPKKSETHVYTVAHAKSEAAAAMSASETAKAFSHLTCEFVAEDVTEEEVKGRASGGSVEHFPATPVPLRGQRHEPPTTAACVRTKVELSGHTFYLILGEYEDGSLAEVFVESPRTGSSTSGFFKAWAKTFSLALQHGTPLDVLVDAMRGLNFEPNGFHEGRPTTSPVDCFARIIAVRYLAQEQPKDTHTVVDELVTELSYTPALKPTGAACHACGSTQLRPSGSCFTCEVCGTTTGCS